MSLSPSISLVLGRLLYEQHVSEAVVRLGLLPSLNAATLRLPLRVRVEATPGDAAELEMDGGEGSEKVLTGHVAEIRRTPMETIVTIADDGARLAKYRPCTTYRSMSAADAIRALASDIGATPGSIDLDLDLPAYTAHQRRTAAEHAARLAALGGAWAGFSARGELDARAFPSSPDAALRYGRELLLLETRSREAPKAVPSLVGAGPAGSMAAPDALLQAAEPLTSGAADPGPDSVWIPAPALRLPAAARTATAAAGARAASRAGGWRAECWLLPSLRPGMVVEIQDLPAPVTGGLCALHSVRHVIDRRGARTFLAGYAAGNAADLLGSALSALGGLL